MADVDEVLEGEGEAVLHEAGGDEDALGRAEADVAMADGAVAEIDGVGGSDGGLVAFADGERHEVISAAGEAIGDRHGHGLYDALQILGRDLSVSKARVADAVGAC